VRGRWGDWETGRRGDWETARLHDRKTIDNKIKNRKRDREYDE